MTENQVNLAVEKWLKDNKYHYKGVCKSRQIAKDENSVGQIPVPDGTRQVLIDHQGVKDTPTIDLLWIEAKGGGDNLSELLQGFIRVTYAVWHGGGRGLLAVPQSEFDMLSEQLPFLISVAKSTERTIGLFNASISEITWFNTLESDLLNNQY